MTSEPGGKDTVADISEWVAEKYPARGHRTGEMLRAAAAEIERLRAIVEQCKATGFLDDAGNVRKAIEADVGLRRHMTDDGAIVLCPSASVYAFERTGDGRFTGRIQKMVYRNWFHCKFDDDMPAQWEQNAPDGKWGCYSSMESAASAMKERGA